MERSNADLKLVEGSGHASFAKAAKLFEGRIAHPIAPSVVLVGARCIAERYARALRSTISASMLLCRTLFDVARTLISG